ncbi:MAG: VIT1/CCC1 transporter family protein [Euryarchaeota archaeon]|nr:VIT1/CCC1 transporter family protein [Euryarchaeota archaeon]
MPTNPTPTERPLAGPGHYLRDAIFGASDGVVTTFAVIASVSGAALAPRFAFVIGLSKLVADALSMAAANYLGLRSEMRQTGVPASVEKPWRHAAVTFLAFMAAGAAPLLSFFVQAIFGVDMYAAAAALAAVTLAVVGALRAPLMQESLWRAGLEMLLIGGGVAVIAYLLSLATEAAVT